MTNSKEFSRNHFDVKEFGKGTAETHEEGHLLLLVFGPLSDLPPGPYGKFRDSCSASGTLHSSSSTLNAVSFRDIRAMAQMRNSTPAVKRFVFYGTCIWSPLFESPSLLSPRSGVHVVPEETARSAHCTVLL